MAESRMAGERGGFGADAFFEIAVGADCVDVMIDGLECIFSIETRGHQLRRPTHADAVCESLSERTGRHFDSGGVSVLRMSGGLRSPLTKISDLVDGHVGIAGQMQQ